MLVNCFDEMSRERVALNTHMMHAMSLATTLVLTVVGVYFSVLNADAVPGSTRLVPSTLQQLKIDVYALDADGEVTTAEHINIQIDKEPLFAMLDIIMQELSAARIESKAKLKSLSKLYHKMRHGMYSWSIIPNHSLCGIALHLHMGLHTELRSSLNSDVPLRCVVKSPCFEISHDDISGLDFSFTASRIKVECDLDAVRGIEAAVSEFVKLFYSGAYDQSAFVFLDIEEDHNFAISIEIPSPNQNNLSLTQDPQVSLGLWHGVLDGMLYRLYVEWFMP